MGYSPSGEHNTAFPARCVGREVLGDRQNGVFGMPLFEHSAAGLTGFMRPYGRLWLDCPCEVVILSKAESAGPLGALVLPPVDV